MKIWTADEIDALRQRYPIDPNDVLAAIFGVSRKTIRCKAHTLGLQKDRPKSTANSRSKVWTESEDARLRREWPMISARVKGHTAQWLAMQMGATVPQVTHRVAVLGLRRTREKEKPWSDDELELLDKWMHLSPKNIRGRMARRGYLRTEGAIIVARYRRFGGLQNSTGSYSARQLAQLLGVSEVPIIGWIRRGWLKATPRGESVSPNGGPGDRWMIYPREVRRFITENPALIGPNVDRIWLIDLLTNRTIQNSPRTAQEDQEGTQAVEVLPDLVSPRKSPESPNERLGR